LETRLGCIRIIRMHSDFEMRFRYEGSLLRDCLAPDYHGTFALLLHFALFATRAHLQREMYYFSNGSHAFRKSSFEFLRWILILDTISRVLL